MARSGRSIGGCSQNTSDLERFLGITHGYGSRLEGFFCLYSTLRTTTTRISACESSGVTPRSSELIGSSFAASVILGVVYGVDLQGQEDPLLGVVHKAVHSAEAILAAGNYLGEAQLPS